MEQQNLKMTDSVSHKRDASELEELGMDDSHSSDANKKHKSDDEEQKKDLVTTNEVTSSSDSSTPKLGDGVSAVQANSPELASSTSQASAAKSNIEDSNVEIVSSSLLSTSSVPSDSCGKVAEESEREVDSSMEADTSIDPEDVSGEVKEQPKQKQILVGLRETDVGIIEYMSNHEGFSGVLKQRYRDFMVNEIDVAGNVIRLTDLSCPDKKPELSFDHQGILSQGDHDKLAELAEGSDKKAEYFIEVTDDKEQRTKVHQVIRHLFPKLESNTVDKDGKKMVKVTWQGGKKGRSRWPKETPNYCRFVLFKQNMEVNEALNIIAKYLHLGPHHFQYAGSKDKRAVTVQEVTAHRVDAERLAQLNKVLKGVRLGNFRYVDRPLNLGELSGNHFVVILRNVQGSSDQINTAITSLRDVGFINYYGMQRFGNSSIPTYHVGRALLLSQWQTAVDLILKPREGASDRDDTKWREHWMDTRDAQSTLKMLPPHKRIAIEQQLLRGLLKSKNDYLAAFTSISRNSRLIYVHSYQSYIWNVITTLRLQKYGMSPVVGDMVSREKKTDQEDINLKVEYITEDNIDAFSIHDVVLPLPGHGVTYPKHQAKEWYTEKLAEDGLSVNSMKSPIRDMSLAGAYRKIVVKPADVDWALYSYDDVKIPLVRTDLEVLENTQLETIPSEGGLKALKVEFSLPSSCYATMALREIMKLDTSAVHQSTLNVYS